MSSIPGIIMPLLLSLPVVNSYLYLVEGDTVISNIRTASWTQLSHPSLDCAMQEDSPGPHPLPSEEGPIAIQPKKSHHKGIGRALELPYRSLFYVFINIKTLQITICRS